MALTCPFVSTLCGRGTEAIIILYICTTISLASITIFFKFPSLPFTIVHHMAIIYELMWDFKPRIMYICILLDKLTEYSAMEEIV